MLKSVTQTSCSTFTATLYVGTKLQYSGYLVSLEGALDTIQEYVDEIGLCVTVTKTDYVYKNGHEPGIIVGFINYPRFPDTTESIRAKALTLAERLLETCRQWKVSVVFPDETVMISTGDQPK